MLTLKLDQQEDVHAYILVLDYKFKCKILF